MTLSDIFNDITNGIFAKINELYPTPWDKTLLVDLDYISSYSNKSISPLVEGLLVDGKLTDEGLTKLANILWGRFGKNWDALYKTMNMEYNPIENYSMIETEGSSFNNSNITQGDSNENSNTSTYGFNSPTATPTGGSTSQLTNNSTNTGKGDSNRTLKRSGNIGVTTTQQMLESERRLWEYDYFNKVFEQANTLLTIPYYE